tara:strand:+ start:684 stop:785 length:102 start_codon:yes stop_codon:yes gene_type:complete
MELATTENIDPRCRCRERCRENEGERGGGHGKK